MKVLIIDHYFDQDIEALLQISQYSYWVVRYSYFYELARKIFPEPVFTGLEAFHRPEYAVHRNRYASAARRRLHELYLMYPFEVVLAPSDTFFWIRPVIEATHELGIPFIVLQKEATIPPGWLQGPAQEWGAIFPFVADWMLVSSEHHRRFWINAGTAPEIITVTGQPRFDIYRQPERWKSWDQLGVSLEPGRRNILFFTYDLSAYLPYIVRDGMIPWKQLREETEAALVALAREKNFNVLIKPHPQPGEDQTDHLLALAANPHVYLLDSKGDTRQYIVNSDVVVGFQTTAMFEALGAGRETIYTFWSEPAVKFADALIPFHHADEALSVARSPDELIAMVQAAGAARPDEVHRSLRDKFFSEYLGPLDGHASERCLIQIERVAEKWRARVGQGKWEMREELAAQAPTFCRRELVRASWQKRFWQAVGILLPFGYPFWSVVRRFWSARRARAAGRYSNYQDLCLEQVADANKRIEACRLVMNGNGSR